MTTDAMVQPIPIVHRDASQDSKSVLRTATAITATLPDSERLLYIAQQAWWLGSIRRTSAVATSDHAIIRRSRLLKGHKETRLAWWDVKAIKVRRGLTTAAITLTRYDGSRYRLGRLRKGQTGRLHTIMAECLSEWREKRRAWDRAQVQARWGVE